MTRSPCRPWPTVPKSDFDAFVDLALGVALDGQEAIMVARVARLHAPPRPGRVLGVIARSETPDVRRRASPGPGPGAPT